MGVLLVASGVVGFFAAKAQVTFNSTMSNVNRDYDTVLENVDLEGIHVNSDNDVINILVIGNDYRKETIRTIFFTVIIIIGSVWFIRFFIIAP